MHTALRSAPTWDTCCHLLQGRLSAQQFRRWIATPDLVASVRNENGYWVLTLACVIPQRCSQLAFEVGTTIERAWHELCQTASRVEYTVQTPAATPPDEKRPAKVIQFPLFPDETRPVSNHMARSALFSCVQGKDRQMMKDVLIEADGGVEIRFSGEQLNQDDHDLLMIVAHYGKHKPLGEYFSVSGNALLKVLGRNKGGKDHLQLRNDIHRGHFASVSIRDPKRKIEYFGHLIEEAVQDEVHRHWVFKLNPNLAVFYQDDSYTLIHQKQRLALKGKDLARWLQLYIASHAEPFPVSVQFLHKKSGSNAKYLKNFRARLKDALKALKANGDIVDWHIDDQDDMVHVERTPSASQARHLLRKIADDTPGRGRLYTKKPENEA